MSWLACVEMRRLYWGFQGSNMSQSFVSRVTVKPLPLHQVQKTFVGVHCQRDSQT